MLINHFGLDREYNLKIDLWSNVISSTFQQLFCSDFIGNRSAFQYSQSAVRHHLDYASCCSVGAGAKVGGDQHIREAEKRMIPAQDEELLTKSRLRFTEHSVLLCRFISLCVPDLGNGSGWVTSNAAARISPDSRALSKASWSTTRPETTKWH